MDALPPCGPSIAGLSAIMQGQQSIAEGLCLAGQWWAAASASNQLEDWRNPLLAAAQTVLAGPEDDLFSSGAEDQGAALLELIGYEAPPRAPAASNRGRTMVSPRGASSIGPALKLASGRARFKGLPPDFLRAALKANPAAAGAALGEFGDVMSSIRLDRLFQGDTFSLEVKALATICCCNELA
jgi:hypothetical protein